MAHDECVNQNPRSISTATDYKMFQFEFLNYHVVTQESTFFLSFNSKNPFLNFFSFTI